MCLPTEGACLRLSPQVDRTSDCRSTLITSEIIYIEALRREVCPARFVKRPIEFQLALAIDMPKLSSYVQQRKKPDDLEDELAALQLSGSSGSAAAGARPAAPPSCGSNSSFGTSSTSSTGTMHRSVATHLDNLVTAEPAEAISGAAAQPAVAVLSPQLQAAATKLREEYKKRLCEHGPRLFRHPDGSLQPEQPPPDPFAVVSAAARGTPHALDCCPHNCHFLCRPTARSGGAW